MISFPDFISLFDNVFFFFFALFQNATQGFGWNMLVLSLIDVETLGSYHKVNSYYDYYMLTLDLPALRGESETLMMHSA